MQVKDLLVLGNARILGEAQINGQAVVLLSDLTITFVIDDKFYTALRGMTWHEWVHSSYNTAGATLTSDGRIQMGAFVATDYGIGYQYDTDVIAAGKSYRISA